MLKGGCFCGYVRYEAGGAPFRPGVCHCSMCRRTAGAPTSLASSAEATRTFCPRCGTPLTFVSDEHSDEIDVTTASLDDPEAVPPRDHTHTATRLRWVRLAYDLPGYPGPRPRP